MKKLLLGLAITALSVHCVNSYINEDVTEELIVVEAEPITEELNNEIEVEIVESTYDPIEIALQEVEQKMSEIESIEDEMEWFIAYKEIINEYYGRLDPPETVFDYFTEDEVRLICKVVETETYDQDFISKVNVANVVLNRYYSGEFGETIVEIVTAENQFAYGRDSITKDTILAVMYAFEIQDTTNGCIAFRSRSKPEEWYVSEYCIWYKQFEDKSGHAFYK